ncbi:MAG: PAS domain-containing protein [Burkholderiales bacterium]|nr:PAS domain-containing protein [Burkholderiales bacterium]
MMEIKLTDAQIFEALKCVAELIPTPLYWCDVNITFLGVNNLGLQAIGLDTKEELIGKNVYEVYRDNVIAEKLREDAEYVINSGQSTKTIDEIVNTSTGAKSYYLATRSALRSLEGKIIGIVGSSIDVTAGKELINLRKEHDALCNTQKEVEARYKQLTSLVANFFNQINGYYCASLNTPKSVNKSNLKKEDIMLTKEQLNILYLLARGKGYSDIAKYLTVQGISLSSNTVCNIVVNQLFPMFNVENVKCLVESATELCLIPLILDRFEFNND